MQHGSKILESDLVWYYTERDGDLGRRGVALEPSIRGEVEVGPTTRQLAAARRVAEVEAALYALSHEHQRLLRLAHTTVMPALRARLVSLGELAGVIVDSVDPARLAAALHASQSKSVKSRPEREEARAWLAQERSKALGVVSAAVSAFRAEVAALKTAERQAKRARIEARTKGWMEEVRRNEKPVIGKKVA